VPTNGALGFHPIRDFTPDILRWVAVGFIKKDEKARLRLKGPLAFHRAPIGEKYSGRAL
jgi:hypothetical protein